MTVLEISAYMRGVVTRFIFFYSPVKFEDSMGRIWPVPLEYSLGDLRTVVRSKFVDHPGAEKVEAGNYLPLLMNQLDHNPDMFSHTSLDNHELPAGMTVVMAMEITCIVE